MPNATQDLIENNLITAALLGNDEAFAGLVSLHKRRIFHLAARFAHNSHEIEDICQETFIKVYENLGKFRHEGSFAHWIKKIAVRVCLNALRNRRQEKLTFSMEDVAAGVEDPKGTAQGNAFQAKDLLNRAMNNLKPNDRLVVTLLSLEEMTIKEVSDVTGWSETNIKVRAWRARRILKNILEKYDAESLR
jgi:RNA polymerase sigma-70 factor, ECF subfamily